MERAESRGAGRIGPVVEVPISQFQQAVNGLHGCKSTHLAIIRVVEDFQGQRVWEGDVYIFALDGHPTAAKCYAWSHALEGSRGRRFVAVLHEPPIVSPRDAVKASIVAEHREQGE